MKVLDDMNFMGHDTHQQYGVIVELTLPDTEEGSGSNENSSASCSGIDIRSLSEKHTGGLIITSGLILKPLFNINSNENSDLQKFVFDVPTVGQNVLYWRTDDRTNITLYMVPATNDSKIHGQDNKSFYKKSAHIIAVWRVPTLSRVLNSIFSLAAGWSFIFSQDGCLESMPSVAGALPTLAMPSTSTRFKHEREEELTRKLLPLFVLLKTSETINSKSQVPTIDRSISMTVNGIDQNTPLLDSLKSLSYCNCKKQEFHLHPKEESIDHTTSVTACYKTTINFIDYSDIMVLRSIYSTLPTVPAAGTRVKLVSTPFGSLSPSVFLNSLSEGIVSNVAGEEGVLIMTDARCVPGCEGGALYRDAINESGPRQVSSSWHIYI